MDRPRVVFVPGFMQRGDAWRPVAERVGTTYRSTCLDHHSATFAGRIEEIADAVGPDAVLVGYSMGGRLALHAAVEHRVAPAALVVIGAGAGIEDAAAREARRSADERLAHWIERHSIEAVVEAWEGLPLFATQSRELREALRPGRLRHEPHELASLLRTAGQGALPPIWHRLGEVGCPTLLLAGEADDDYVAAAHRMAGEIPLASARLIPGAGHAPQLEQPAAFTRVLVELLDGVASGGPRGSTRALAASGTRSAGSARGPCSCRSSR